MKKLKIPFLKEVVEITIIRTSKIESHFAAIKRQFNQDNLKLAPYSVACCIRKVPDYFILLPEKPSVSTCAHEALHCVEDIMNSYNLVDEELKAYLVGWITEECYRK